jgi:hypothetical protein
LLAIAAKTKLKTGRGCFGLVKWRELGPTARAMAKRSGRPMMARLGFQAAGAHGDLGKTHGRSPVAVWTPSRLATRSLGLTGVHRVFTERLLWADRVAVAGT